MKPLSQRSVNKYSVIFLILVTLLLIYSGSILNKNMVNVNLAIKQQEKTLRLGTNIEEVINELTDLSRSFVNNYDLKDLNEYWNQINVENKKDKIILNLNSMDIPEEESNYIVEAKKISDELEKIHVHSMKLIFLAKNYDNKYMPPRIRKYQLPDLENSLSNKEKLELASDLVFGEEYLRMRKEIRENISSYRRLTDERTTKEIDLALNSSNEAFKLQKISLILMILGGLIILIFDYSQVGIPLMNYTKDIDKSLGKRELIRLEPKGSREIRELAKAFNKNAEEKEEFEFSLRETEYKLKLHMHLMPLAAIEYDNNFIITHWNKAAEKVFGFTKEEAVGRSPMDLIIPKDIMPEIKEILIKLRLGDKSGETSVNKNITKDGRIITCDWSNTPIFNQFDELIGWLCLAKDITEEKEKQDKILYLSQHDPLTGLYNRGYMLEQLEVEKTRFNRSKKPFSVIIFDIDFFKSVNDNYGHEAGDNVLKTVSSIMIDTVRNTDFVGRWGGEEFLIILPFTDTDGAYKLAEKVRKNIENERFIYNNQILKLTITGGISCSCEGNNVADYIRSADDALLQGKDLGRNIVIKAGC